MTRLIDKSTEIIDKIKRSGSVEQLSKKESMKINARIYNGMEAVKRDYVKRESESEWIDVNKKLPEKLSYCLVYNIISKLGTGEIAWCFYNSAGKWCGENEYYENVSHWMPLPLAPNKEK